MSQCHVGQHDYGCHCLLLGVAKSLGCPPGPGSACGPAALSPAQGNTSKHHYLLHPAQSEYTQAVLLQGVVRIYLLEAQNLAAQDSYVKGVMAGLSDPYAIMRVGPQHFTSKHVDNTDSPTWNETYEVRAGLRAAVVGVRRRPFSFHFGFFPLQSNGAAQR